MFNVDFGIQFLSECDNYIQQIYNMKINCQQEVLDLKGRCLSMLEEALDQVGRRLASLSNKYI